MILKEIEVAVFARFFKSYWFLLGTIAVLVLAYYTGPFGVMLHKSGGKVFAIVGLFLMSGLSVSLEKLHADLTQWKHHVLILLYLFGFMPAVMYFSSLWLNLGTLTLGVYLVAALPTTISSSVAFTTSAGGSTPTAIISSVGTNLLAVAVSPFLIGLMTGGVSKEAMGAAGSAIQEMVLLVLLPFGVGQMIGHFFPIFHSSYRKTQSVLAQCLVLFMMYGAFSGSVAKLLVNLRPMWQCFAYLAVLHFVFVGCALGMIRLLKIAADKGAAIFFCCTQKTMAFGLPLALAYWKDDAVVGIVIIPLTFYYILQMFTSTFMLHWWQRRIAAA